ncbi:hypothetical protein L2E82_49198 [Cichorium intybus]|uniref:Uncharacterized protein n=1 Tax=Cichorium intybus TaxID=13427 RepID=A0ACB8Z433_CICIN|nr:hypothetical protein L2E82_49198 [Cichorium intybus]
MDMSSTRQPVLNPIMDPLKKTVEAKADNGKVSKISKFLGPSEVDFPPLVVGKVSISIVVPNPLSESLLPLAAEFGSSCFKFVPKAFYYWFTPFAHLFGPTDSSCTVVISSTPPIPLDCQFHFPPSSNSSPSISNIDDGFTMVTRKNRNNLNSKSPSLASRMSKPPIPNAPWAIFLNQPRLHVGTPGPTRKNSTGKRKKHAIVGSPYQGGKKPMNQPFSVSLNLVKSVVDVSVPPNQFKSSIL